MQKKFKKTPAGDIPVDWEVGRLAEICTFIGRGSSPKYVESSPIAVIGQRTVREQGFVPSEARPVDEAYAKTMFWAKEGDVLLNSTGTGTIGRSCIFPALNGYVVDSHVTVIRPDQKKIIPKLIDSWLRSANGQEYLAHNCFTGSTNQIELSRTALRDLPLPLPPPFEQHEIAEILSAVDDTIEKTDAVIKKTHQILNGLMQQLLVRGIGHTKFQKTDIGTIPEGWAVVSIRQIGSVVTGGTPDTANRESWDGNFPFVTPMDMGRRKEIKETNRKVSVKGLEVAGRIPENAVMVTCIGSTIGKIGISSEVCCANQQINSVICTEKIEPAYLYYYLLSKISSLRQLAGHTAVPIINKKTFSEFKVPLPAVKEQATIAAMLSVIDDRISNEEHYQLHLTQVKTALMQVLLTGKVRIKH